MSIYTHTHTHAYQLRHTISRTQADRRGLDCCAKRVGVRDETKKFEPYVPGALAKNMGKRKRTRIFGTRSITIAYAVLIAVGVTHWPLDVPSFFFIFSNATLDYKSLDDLDAVCFAAPASHPVR